MQNIIKSYLSRSSETLQSLNDLGPDIEAAASMLINTVKCDNKVLICGNGGSAADSQHIAAEVISRFRKERASVAAIALSTNTSILTAVSNDYDFKTIFSRQVEGLGKSGDLLIAITTSGNSENVVAAAQTAKKMGMQVLSLTGSSGGKLTEISDVVIKIPSEQTSHIQEGHLVVYHLLCHLIEEKLF